MVLLGTLYSQIKHTLKQGGINTPELDARALISYGLNIAPDMLILNPDIPVPMVHAQALDALIAKRLGGMPVSKIIGTREFYGLEFIVNEHVLDPRPDTEILIDAVLADFKNREGGLNAPWQILDICTGSGCIAISLLKHLPNASAVATDISPDALFVARQNAQKHGLEGRITFIQTSFLDGINQPFDALVSNPPYIQSDVIPTLSPEVKNHDPILALDGGIDGLNPYREIFPQIRALLKTNAKAYFEMGYDQSQSLSLMAERCGLQQHDVLNDYAGNARVIIVS